jgi:predicted nucleic acid-binding protein
VDTSVIVTPFLKNRSADVIARCDAFLDAAAQRGEPVATSWLTWDEVVWSLGRSAPQFDRRRAAELSDALLQVEFLRFLPVDRATIELAASLFARSSSRPRDCIHAAAALRHCAGQLVSLDSDFSSQALAAVGLTVREP